ncbi:MAG: hypothetical protein OEZ51_06900 [Nitrospinota bacterium]|nr:hypothetical protein [Nitrospinota bacterium]
MNDIIDPKEAKKSESAGWDKTAAIVWSVIGLAILVSFILYLPELEIFKYIASAGEGAAQHEMFRTKLQYYAIIVIVVCLTLGICIILYLSLSGSGKMNQERKLEFSLKYVAIAIIANAAFMLGILDTGNDGQTVDKIITLYAGIAGYVLGSAGTESKNGNDK